METITYGDIIVYYLKKDYRVKSLLLNNLSIHVDDLYDNFVLTTDDKKKINTLISETINNLNEYYNNMTIQLYPNMLNDNICKDNKLINKVFCYKNDFDSTIETINILKDNNCVLDVICSNG